VFAEIIDIFPDPVVHLGGDEVVLTCLQNKTEFVKKENIQERDIERHYRRKQHKIIKELDPKKTPMYWMNSQIDI
jgi:N-acetyl-beta-hexosaminidase